MAHLEDAKELVKHAKGVLPKLEQDYKASLNEKTIKPALLIEIKSVMEHLRSALDFAAHGLFAKFGSSAKSNPRIYFPYAPITQSESEFKTAKRIETCIPGLTASRPDIVTLLESYQHYSNPANRWLPVFMELNNENKHERLTPQTRQEARQLRIESGGAAIELGPGASISVGQGASIQFGNIVIPGGQDFSGERPAVIFGAGTQSVTIWVSFIFSTNGEHVIPFLTNAAAQVERIVQALAAI